MTDHLLLSLRASPKADPNKDSLPFLISRISEQRGSFRNVTEESLQEEIRALDAGQAETVEETSPDEEVQDAKSRRDELATAREEMLRQVTQAYNESAQALDVISLLVSRHAPRQAEQTLNPYIKNALPLGVLGMDTVQVPQKTNSQKHTDSLISMGWKLQSLDSVADTLLRSAARLEQEMERETKYWGQVLAIKEQGWSLCRLPGERHTLGVKYGFGEAYADFRDRGLAALRRNEDGDISLDRGPHALDRVLRVQIVQKGKVLSSSLLARSCWAEDKDGIDDVPIEQRILRARNSIYDEELHSELHREARNLVNQGVRCKGNTIQLPYEADNHVEIDVLLQGEKSSEKPHDDNITATAIAIALRILLSRAHSQNLHRRSQPPPPIVDSKLPRPVYPILKPIIENIRHRSDVQSVRDCLAVLAESLHSAGLSLKNDQTAVPLNLPSNLSIFGNGGPSVTDFLLNTLTSPLHTSLDLQLPSQQTSLKTEVHTNLFPPTLGTDFRTTITSSPHESLISALPHTMQFTACAELEEYILHLLSLDLVSFISSSDRGWGVIDPNTGSMSRTVRDSNGKLQSTSLRASFENRQLCLEWQKRKEGEEEVQRGMERWKGGDVGKRSFMDVIKDLADNMA